MATDIGPDRTSQPTRPPPDQTPPRIDFEGLESYTAPDMLTITASDPGGGLASVEVALFGSPPTAPWHQRLEVSDGAELVQRAWRLPPYGGYALVTARVKDTAGHVTRGYRWLNRPPSPAGAPQPVRVRANASLFDASPLRRVTDERLHALMEQELGLPRPIADVPGHELTLAALRYANPEVTFAWRHDKLLVRGTLSDIRATIAVRGWLDRDVLVRGGLGVEIPIEFGANAVYPLLSIGAPRIRLRPFSVDAPGLTSTIRRRLQARLWMRAFSYTTLLNAQLQAILGKPLTHSIRLDILGNASVVPVELLSWKARVTGLATQWRVAHRKEAHEGIASRCPTFRPTGQPPPHVEADIPMSEAVRVGMMVWQSFVDTGPWRFELPIGTATVSAPRAPRVLGCAKPGHDAIFVQIPGISVQTLVGKGVLSVKGSADVGLVLGIQTRTKGGRAQVRATAHWVWSDAPFVQHWLSEKLDGFRSWRDVPTMDLPSGLTLRVTRVTPHGKTLRVEGMLQ